MIDDQLAIRMSGIAKGRLMAKALNLGEEKFQEWLRKTLNKDDEGVLPKQIDIQ